MGDYDPAKYRFTIPIVKVEKAQERYPQEGLPATYHEYEDCSPYQEFIQIEVTSHFGQDDAIKQLEQALTKLTKE
jgi:hypothetical protein